jgi:hypothetical protein
VGRKINSGGWVHGKEENKQKHPLLILILICAMLLFAMYLSRIRYLGFFPYVNKPATLCEFDEMGEVAIIYHIFAPIGYLLLLLLVIHTARRGKKKKKVARKPAAQSGGAQPHNIHDPGFLRQSERHHLQQVRP